MRKKSIIQFSNPGPDDPYYFGLTVSDTASAQFGVNCDMPGLHFEDTCVTDEDCSEFPNTGETDNVLKLIS